MKQRLVYVASLGHSGSTLVDLLLGRHPQAVGLGEVMSTIELHRREHWPCSCGASAESCPFWAPLLDTWRDCPELNKVEAYQQVMERASSRFAGADVVIDSSKHLASLKMIRSQDRWDLRVLFLIKDVRAYMTSTIRRPTRRYPPLGRLRVVRALQWYRRNRVFAEYLKTEGIPFFQFGYEELCFRTKEILNRICDFVEISPYDLDATPRESDSHVLRGNLMRANSHRRESVAYDHRWFHSGRSQLAAMMLPGVMRWNLNNVYANVA